MRKYATKYDKVYKENKTRLIYELHTNFQRLRNRIHGS